MKPTSIVALLLLLGLVNVQADTLIEEIEETAPQQEEPQVTQKKAKRPKLSLEETAKLKAEKKQKAQTLQSCLILTRAHYNQN